MEKKIIANDPAEELSEIGYSNEELNSFKKSLLEKRQEILEEAQQTLGSECLVLDRTEVKDDADLASFTIQQNLTFRLLDRSRKLLAEIQRALKKIEEGEYGYCEGTGDVIPKRRLMLAPWARHSVEHKERLEHLKKNNIKSYDKPSILSF